MRSRRSMNDTHPLPAIGTTTSTQNVPHSTARSSLSRLRSAKDHGHTQRQTRKRSCGVQKLHSAQGIGAGIRQGCQRLACNWLGRTERRRQWLCCRGWRRCRWTRILLLLGLFLLRSGHAHFAGTWHLRMQYRCSVRRTAVLACTWSIHCSMARSSAWHVRAGGAHHLESAGGTARGSNSGKRPSKAASLAPTPARLYKRTIRIRDPRT